MFHTSFAGSPQAMCSATLTRRLCDRQHGERMEVRAAVLLCTWMHIDSPRHREVCCDRLCHKTPQAASDSDASSSDVPIALLRIARGAPRAVSTRQTPISMRSHIASAPRCEESVPVKGRGGTWGHVMRSSGLRRGGRPRCSIWHVRCVWRREPTNHLCCRRAAPAD